VDYSIAIAAIAAVTAIGLAAEAYTTLADPAMLYLIAITAASLRGRGPALLAASLAVVAFDVCFVPPRFTFAVADARYLVTFAVMFGAGLAISTLTTRLRREEVEASGREQRTAALLAFTREVAAATTSADVAIALARHLEDSLGVAAAVLLPEGTELVAAAGLMPLAAHEATTARWAYEHRAVAGRGAETLPDARGVCVPLPVGDSAVGVLVLQRTPALGGEQRELIDAMARQAGVAIARVELAAQAKDAAVKIRTEELRSSLLSAVSHDLRTPLAVITGAATTLRDTELPPGERDALLSSIVDDATRLERVLANLLQLTRVETGMTPAREWVPAEEVVGAALTRLETAIGDRAVELDVDADAQLHVDPVLFEQVVINLIENALKHAAPPILVRARADELAIGDRGAGFTRDPARLFEKFVRASSAPGAGLGLAVVRAIVEAHGGTVTAENRPGGGALFTVKL